MEALTPFCADTIDRTFKYAVSHKNVTLLLWLYLYQMLTDITNFLPWRVYEICYKIHVTFSTTLQICRRTIYFGKPESQICG